ncbi:MAG: M28 family peptidase [Chitinophagaceae bacterium]
MIKSFYLFIYGFIALPVMLHAQPEVDTIKTSEAARIINILASDSLKGRGNLQPGLLKAANFIGDEFSKIGLTPLAGFQDYFIPFQVLDGKKISKDSSFRKNNSRPVNPMIGYNIVGVLPGKSKPNEIIIISAHYDHEGVFALKQGDSILNGANDNASGTTALLLLAKYFTARNDNERTLLFCAFSGEEMGLKGSHDFISYTNPKNIAACINLEMIGIPQFGAKTVFITGDGISSLHNLLSKKLKENGLTITPEPDPTNPEQKLFRRSDNYPFALEGIPAHTIMASDDDDDCYHQPCDEIKRIDIENMTAITRAIAASLRTLINGEETPKSFYK